ncbi:MAG: hypothetical protein KDI92_07270 [Xanthomonadales bacterium]|nr:hypothetical protein [Xanthomonadales bacterium]
MKIKSLILLFVLVTTAGQSMIAYSPDAIQIKEINGKLYQMTREEWYQENVSPDDTNEVKPQQWDTIIKKGNPELTTALLHALGQFLPNDELERYLTLGLLRKQNMNKQSRFLIAQSAYQIWRDKLGWESAYQIRTNEKLRQNLMPAVQWKSLFYLPENQFSSAAEAVDYIHSLQTQVEITDHRYKIQQAINKIYQHNDLDDLKLWMKDSEFPVALGSWLALHRLAPEKHAKEILENAIWWQAEIPYTYGSGCIRVTAHLTPVLAALDLFSDYLTTDQIHKVLLDVPDIWNTSGIYDFTVNNPQTYEVLQRFDHQFKHMYNFEKIQTNKKLQHMTSDELAVFFTDTESRYLINELTFNQNLLDYLSNELKTNAGFDGDIFLNKAFNSKNEYARQFVKLYIDKQLAKVSQMDHNNLKDSLLTYISIWPRDWQALKQQVITQLQ